MRNEKKELNKKIKKRAIMNKKGNIEKIVFALHELGWITYLWLCFFGNALLLPLVLPYYIFIIFPFPSFTLALLQPLIKFYWFVYICVFSCEEIDDMQPYGSVISYVVTWLRHLT